MFEKTHCVQYAGVEINPVGPTRHSYVFRRGLYVIYIVT